MDPVEQGLDLKLRKLLSRVTSPNILKLQKVERVQGFCGVCGTSLYAADADKQKFNIRLGFINQRDQLVPSKHIFGDSAASWLKQIEQHQWFARMP